MIPRALIHVSSRLSDQLACHTQAKSHMLDMDVLVSVLTCQCLSSFVLLYIIIQLLQWLAQVVVPRDAGVFTPSKPKLCLILMVVFSHTKSRKGCENWYA